MDFGTLLPERSMEDILARRIRLDIGGEVYTLPVLPIAENRAWKERMDLELGFLLANLAKEDDMEGVMGLFDGSEATFMDLLKSYDRLDLFTEDEIARRGLTPLPSVEVIERHLDPWPLIQAVLEVWRAARPLADIALTGETLTLEPPVKGSRPHMPTWLRRLGGRTATSRAN